MARLSADTPGALLAEAVLSEAARALDGAGVGFAAIKGVALARRLYGPVDSRGVPFDTDLLVRHAEAADAIEVLGGIGYSSPYLPAPPSLLKGVWKVALRKQLDAGAVATIELHWAPFSPVTFPLEESVVWHHIEPFAMPTLTVPVPDRELTLVLLACHIAQSGLSSSRLLGDFGRAWELWAEELDHLVLASLISGARARAVFAYACLAVSTSTRSGKGPASDGSENLGGPSASDGSENSVGPSASSGAKCTVELPSVAARLAARLWPDGRVGKSGVDYRGQLAALLLCSPSRLPSELARALVPSPAHVAVATDTPIPGVDRYVREVASRFRRIASDLVGES